VVVKHITDKDANVIMGCQAMNAKFKLKKGRNRNYFFWRQFFIFDPPWHKKSKKKEKETKKKKKKK
jgi:hypothetical protein